jgi:hypothetical protein
VTFIANRDWRFTQGQTKHHRRNHELDTPPYSTIGGRADSSTRRHGSLETQVGHLLRLLDSVHSSILTVRVPILDSRHSTLFFANYARGFLVLLDRAGRNLAGTSDS